MATVNVVLVNDGEKDVIANIFTTPKKANNYVEYAAHTNPESRYTTFAVTLNPKHPTLKQQLAEEQKQKP